MFALFAWPKALTRVIFRHVQSRFKLHSLHPYVHSYLKTPRLDILVLLLFLGANIFCLSFKTGGIDGFVKRSGSISVVNLIPLSLGGHLNPIADFCGIDLKSYVKLHRWLGWVAVIEALIHTTVTVSVQKPNLQASSNIAALTVSVFIRRREFNLRSTRLPSLI